MQRVGGALWTRNAPAQHVWTVCETSGRALSRLPYRPVYFFVCLWCAVFVLCCVVVVFVVCCALLCCDCAVLGRCLCCLWCCVCAVVCVLWFLYCEACARVIRGLSTPPALHPHQTICGLTTRITPITTVTDFVSPTRECPCRAHPTTQSAISVSNYYVTVRAAFANFATVADCGTNATQVGAGSGRRNPAQRKRRAWVCAMKEDSNPHPGNR